MTAHQLQQKQRNMKPTEVCSPRKSPRLIKQQVKNAKVNNSTVNRRSNEATSRWKPALQKSREEIRNSPKNLNSATVKRKLALQPHGDENTDENDISVRSLQSILYLICFTLKYLVSTYCEFLLVTCSRDIFRYHHPHHP